MARKCQGLPFAAILKSGAVASLRLRFARVCAAAGIALAVCLPLRAAADVTFTIGWDPSPGPDVTGYVVKWGTAPGEYPNEVRAGNTTTLELTVPDGAQTYYIVVQAVDADG